MKSVRCDAIWHVRCTAVLAADDREQLEPGSRHWNIWKGKEGWKRIDWKRENGEFRHLLNDAALKFCFKIFVSPWNSWMMMMMMINPTFMVTPVCFTRLCQVRDRRSLWCRRDALIQWHRFAAAEYSASCCCCCCCCCCWCGAAVVMLLAAARCQSSSHGAWRRATALRGVPSVVVVVLTRQTDNASKCSRIDDRITSRLGLDVFAV